MINSYGKIPVLLFDQQNVGERASVIIFRNFFHCATIKD